MSYHFALHEAADGLWVHDCRLTMLGVPIISRMTLVRLPDGRLWVHSPTRLTDDLRAAVDRIGPLGAIAAPNTFHHVYAGEWRAAYPDARLDAAPGLDRKRPDLKPDGTLGGTPPDAWAGALTPVAIAGMPKFNETVFIHAATRTLICSDLVFNVGADVPLRTRLLLRLSGTYNRFAASRLVKLLIKDRAAFDAALDRVLAQPFDRIVMAHGEVVETGGAAQLRAAFDRPAAP